MKHKAKNTIENIILHSMRKITVIAVVCLGALCLLFLYFESLKNLKGDLKNEIATAAKRVELSVNGYKNVVQDLGTVPGLSSRIVPIEYKEKIIDRKCVEYNFLSGRIINLDGFSDMDDFFRGDQKYFLKALEGEVLISDPTLSREDNAMMFFVASPVWKEGIVGGKIDSVVFCSLDSHFLTDLVKNFPISAHSDAYIINKEGQTVAAMNEHLFFVQNNNIRNAEKQKSYRKIAKIEKRILNGDMEPTFYWLGATLNCFVAADIDGTQGWKVIIRTPLYDYLKTFYIFFAYVFFIGVGCWLYAFRKSSKISKIISVPVKNLAGRLRLAAEGDYTSDVIDSNQVEEVKMISEATQSLMNRMDSLLNGSDRYKESVSIDKLLDSTNFMPFFRNYLKKYNVLVCIKDTQGKLLTGNESADAKTIFREKMILNGRFVGFMEMTPGKNCRLSEKSMKEDLAVYVEVLERVMETNLRNVVQYKIWRENEDVNIKRYIGMTEEISTDLHRWIDELDELNNLEEKKNFRKGILNFTEKTKAALIDIDDSFEFIKFSDWWAASKERDYSVVELVENVAEKISIQLHSTDCISIEAAESRHMVRRLYGDFDGISHFVTRFVSCFNNKNPSKKIGLYFSTSRKTYACNLKIDFTLESGLLSDEEIEKIRELCEKIDEKFLDSIENNTAPTSLENSKMDSEKSSIERYISNFSQIYSVFKMIQLMNCEVVLKKRDDGIVISIEIAQLEGGS